ncbi:RNA polymerase sigma factor [Sphingobacterium suaedae]|uniref:RNA polymerase sigma factor n=1 Tax=Sphingobacterium suaedae TaxID=1686402 RepID=A0ABW5KFF4_9SPHI
MGKIISIYKDWLIAIKTHDDKQAFSELYRCFWQDLFMHALRRVKDEQQAEDIVQELFIGFWEQRGKIDTEMNLPAYLYGMLKYKIIDHYQSAKAKPILLENLAEELERFVHEHPHHLETYLALEKLLADELEKMPGNMKAAMLMRWDNVNIREIASRLQLSEQTVKNNLTEGSRRLKVAVARHGSGKFRAFLPLLALTIEHLNLL